MANEFKVRKGLVVNGSGSVILDVQGSQGQLFSVTDQLSGSLFSVNDISGVPVLEAFSDSTVKIGQYLAEAIIVSGSTARITGSMSLAGFSTGSVLFAGTGGAISQNNSNFFWDNTNSRLGIGANAPLDFNLVVQGVIQVRNTANSFTGLRIDHNSIRYRTTGTFGLGSNDSATAINIFSTNNIGINATSDSGERLQVSGSSRFMGNVVITGSGATSATNALTVLNSNGTGSLIVRNDGQIQVRSTGAGNPGYSFIDNTDTGLYMIGTGMYNVVDSVITVAYGSNGIAFNASGSTNSETSANLQLTKTGVGHRLSVWLNNNNDFHFEAWENSVGYANNIILNGYGGAVILGATTSTGEKLQVTGTTSLKGNTAITGSLTVTDTITAQRLVVQTITSSVSYMSGSTIFGNNTSNTHQFTGSVSITGSLTSNGDVVIRGSGATSATNALLVQNSNGTNMVSIRNDGTIRFGTQTVLLSPTGDGSSVSLAGRGLLLQTGLGTAAGVGEFTIVGSINPSSLNSWTFRSVTSFIPDLGTATYSGLLLNQTINQTGGANGITRGIYVAPTLTSAWDYRSIEWSNNASATSGSWGLYGSGSAPNYLSGSLGIGTTAIGSNALTVTGTTLLSGSVTSSTDMLVNGRLTAPIGINTSGVTFGQSATSPFVFSFVNNGYTSPNSTGLNLGYFNYTTTATGTQYHFALGGNQINPISGDHTGLFYARTFAPSSGTATFGVVTLRPTISQSSATGATTGIVVNPILTSATDWRSIQWNNDAGFGLYGAGTAPNFLSGSLGIGITTPSSSIHINSSTVSNAFLITTPNNNTTLYPFFIGGVTLTSDVYLRANSSIIEFRRNGNPSTIRTVGSSNNLALEGSQHIVFSTNGANERARFTSGGNLLLNDTVDDTFNRLQVSGNARISQALTASQALISGSGTQRLTVVGSGSAQPIFTVQGSQGELFSIVDSLSGSLFSVNDQSGLPIMEVFSDNTILMGNYLDPMLLTTTRTGSAAGINTIYSLPTSSYDAVYIDYTIRSGSNARAGNFMAMWSGTSVNFTDNSITEFGSTSTFTFGAHVSGANMVVTGSAPTAGWTIKTIIKAI